MKSITIGLVLACISLGFYCSSSAQTIYTRTILDEQNHHTKKTATTVTGTWTRQNPIYSLSTVKQLFFVNELQGWVTGGKNYNEIRRTADGAKTWEIFSGPVPVGNYAQWDAVFFVDELTGWQAAGHNIIHTHDGGLTWVNQDNGVPTTSVISKLCFANALIGWALDATGNILRTINGGDLWQVTNIGTAMYLNDLFFINSQVGWVAGYTFSSGSLIRKTTDGGITWTPQNSSLSMSWNAVYFLSPDTGFVGGQNYLIKTTNGGETWNPVFQQSGANFNQLRFFNEQNGWCLDNTSRGKLLRTIDGGITWLDKTPEYGVFVEKCFFIDQATGYAANSYGLFAKTTNAGEQWEYLSGITNSNLWSVFPVDNYSVWCSGGEQSVVQTNSCGLHWDNMLKPEVNPRSFHDITFADSKNGWMCYSAFGRIYATNDGGLTWDWERLVPTTVRALHDLVFTDARKGFVFGGNLVNRLLYKTIDGGQSWTVPDFPAGDVIVHGFFLDERTGWALCMGGSVLKTTNGGDNWTEYSTQSDKWLESIFFINLNVGFIVGESTILRSTDGGHTWNSLGDFNGWIEDIHFIDADHGIAVGGGFPASGVMSKTMTSDGIITTSVGTAKVWTTTNGGNTWSEAVIRDCSWLLAAGFSDLNNGWAVGNNGTILRYSNSFGIPVQPSDLSGSGLSSAKIQLSWKDNSDNENGFIVYRRNGLTGSFVPIATLDSNSDSYPDEDFTPGETYWYRVAAFNDTGRSAQTKDITLRGPALGLPEMEDYDEQSGLRLFPNPVLESGSLVFNLSQPESIKISLFLANGMLIDEICNQIFEKGIHCMKIDLSAYSPGIYYFCLEGVHVSKAIRMVLLGRNPG